MLFYENLYVLTLSLISRQIRLGQPKKRGCTYQFAGFLSSLYALFLCGLSEAKHGVISREHSAALVPLRMAPVNRIGLFGHSAIVPRRALGISGQRTRGLLEWLRGPLLQPL